MAHARIESDSIGSLEIPENVYYGVQTERGCRNFDITGIKMNGRFIKNIVRIKKAAATAKTFFKTISSFFFLFFQCKKGRIILHHIFTIV